MVFTRINNTISVPSFIQHRNIEQMDEVLILVPDEQSMHELQGLLFLLNMKTEVYLLEPGTPMSWQDSFSPWHLNTDKYILSFEGNTPIYKERH